MEKPGKHGRETSKGKGPKHIFPQCGAGNGREKGNEGAWTGQDRNLGGQWQLEGESVLEHVVAGLQVQLGMRCKHSWPVFHMELIKKGYLPSILPGVIPYAAVKCLPTPSPVFYHTALPVRHLFPRFNAFFFVPRSECHANDIARKLQYYECTKWNQDWG